MARESVLMETRALKMVMEPDTPTAGARSEVGALDRMGVRQRLGTLERRLSLSNIPLFLREGAGEDHGTSAIVTPPLTTSPCKHTPKKPETLKHLAEKVIPLPFAEFFHRLLVCKDYWDMYMKCDPAFAPYLSEYSKTDWKMGDCCIQRQFSFRALGPDLPFVFGTSSTRVTQRHMCYYTSHNEMWYVTCTQAHDVPYANDFEVISWWQVTASLNMPDECTVRLFVDLVFLTTVWIKGFIQRGALPPAIEAAKKVLEILVVEAERCSGLPLEDALSVPTTPHVIGTPPISTSPLEVSKMAVFPATPPLPSSTPTPHMYAVCGLCCGLVLGVVLGVALAPTSPGIQPAHLQSLMAVLALSLAKDANAMPGGGDVGNVVAQLRSLARDAEEAHTMFQAASEKFSRFSHLVDILDPPDTRTSSLSFLLSFLVLCFCLVAIAAYFLRRAVPAL
mmetsp:Transcript_2918/g.7115  ORF Transcript_2918/g.7115 Transcript_2918/m.7115 type:complete len:449 (-) Transcript_2918:62-1408(-)|eukprot:CAMPEP_0177653632 /NCGR_PEP_ID=MMETSP0447-20121125/13851_1 /TAXON_ID=0 /ORGANISM="Stygamoeba regulata, Strain BSH-02190019" /LENGTH=448 /DNA_ID=CAMNT_0019157125 /DNA_START=77 /DNA_END=1423 /DNA_ORIENTATION=+